MTKLFAMADVEVNGDRDWDIQVHNHKFYKCVLSKGSLGLGESYMQGFWDVAALDHLFCKLLSTNLEHRVKTSAHFLLAVQSKIINLQSIRRAFNIGEQHYDIGNDLFKCMLDKRLTYTCGYWKTATNLDQAQKDKLDLVCRKIGLQKDQRILDIGCGWGSFVKYAAEHYGVRAVGVTVSKEQAEYAQKDCSNLPVDIRLQDYREINEKFDHIVSLGMFEHVGPKNYKTYANVVSRCLKEKGLFLLHTIGSNYTRHNGDPWINKYIFPNGVLPSMKDISMAFEKDFVIEDLHSFGPDYDKTLMAWFHNYDANQKQMREKYGDVFYRMWKYYLLSSAGGFRARNIQLWQFVLSKHGVLGGYNAIR